MVVIQISLRLGLGLGLLATTLATARPSEADLPPRPSYSLSLHEIDPFVLSSYCQDRYQRVDARGDYSLALKARLTPMQILWQVHKPEALAKYRAQMAAALPIAQAQFDLKPRRAIEYADKTRAVREIQRRVSREFRTAAQKTGLAQQEHAALEDLLLRGRLDFKGRTNPFPMASFTAMLVQVIREESARGLPPTRGEFHAWSPEFQRNYGAEFLPYSALSKLVVALARGETANYLVTGSENELLDWIHQQPTESIWPHALFRQSYRINRGDLYLTLLTIENVLARWWMSPDRQYIVATRRLKPILNQIGMNTDNFGAWYHLYGILLYGYCRGAFDAHLVGTLETLGSLALSRFDYDPQEDAANFEGGRIGSMLSRMIREADHRVGNDPGATDPARYLNLREDYTKAIQDAAQRLRNGKLKESIGTGDSEVGEKNE